MTIQVGSMGKGKLELKYGSPFPEVGGERYITSPKGRFLIRYTWIGTPEWTPKYTVLIPTKFKIVEITEIATEQKAKDSGFTIVE